MLQENFAFLPISKSDPTFMKAGSPFDATYTHSPFEKMRMFGN
jgi:hypothetical protein